MMFSRWIPSAASALGAMQNMPYLCCISRSCASLLSAPRASCTVQSNGSNVRAHAFASALLPLRSKWHTTAIAAAGARPASIG